METIDDNILIRCGACQGQVNFSSDYCSHCKCSFHVSVKNPRKCVACRSHLINGGEFGLKCEVSNTRPSNLDRIKNGELRRRVISPSSYEFIDYDDQNLFFFRK